MLTSPRRAPTPTNRNRLQRCGGSFSDEVITVPSGQLVQYGSDVYCHDSQLNPIVYSLEQGPAGMAVDAT